MKKIAYAAVLAGVMGLTGAGAAWAEDYEVHMLNRGAEGAMVFEPAFLELQPGDTVTFLPTNPSHNAETISSMLPEGAEPFRGALNQAVTVTFDEEGLYGIKCAPHYAAGMIVLIEVGDGEVVNGEAARAARHPGLARRRMSALFDQLDATQ
ncbi:MULTISPECIES: pseudoazurin [Maricaulis]|jgi:pseudoazurin|uniref:Pseudoazurin n=1 Tax=Maricaulis maris (strain MCS10) TaxID=394221 RepID=Q0ATA9_MARMM|nr:MULTISPECIES: pseudoazurin [Maricaulis]ABI64478.1 pseudoazurin [Maricaulis maris MCS10]MAC88670.1 pseudoazurin [Maricaulis sp.]